MPENIFDSKGIYFCYARPIKQVAVIISILLLGSSLAGKPETKPVKKGIVARSVLIFDFANQTGKADYDYLSGSIAEALVEPIKKTRQFRVMSRDSAKTAMPIPNLEKKMETVLSADSFSSPESPKAIEPPMHNAGGNPAEKTQPEKSTTTLSKYDVNEAIQLGRKAGADVVVLGKFTELDGILLLSAQVYETDTKLLKASEEILTKSDTSIFFRISMLADKLAGSMARELPMFDADEAERRRTKEPVRQLVFWRF